MYSELYKALEESVKLQSHYAELLNIHDGGHRIGFASADGCMSWLYLFTEESKMGSEFYEMLYMYKDLLLLKEKCNIFIFIFLWATIPIGFFTIIGWAIAAIIIRMIES